MTCFVKKQDVIALPPNPYPGFGGRQKTNISYH